MARALLKNGNGQRGTQASKYDANNTVLSKTYGAFADLRRELADSKAAVGEREELLQTFATCSDSQRAWLLLEDYFEKLSLSRKDFPTNDWWPRLLASQQKTRLEELAFLFMRARRTLPTELLDYANLDRFEQVEKAAQEQQLVTSLEEWLFPPKLTHLEAPRASLRVLCEPQPDLEQPSRHRLGVQLHLLRPRAGEKVKSVAEIVDLTTRAAHEQEQFPPNDWEFIQWLAETRSAKPESKSRKGDIDADDYLVLSDVDFLHWLTRWGHTGKLELKLDDSSKPIEFHGQIAEFVPHLENGDKELSFTQKLKVPGGGSYNVNDAKFFTGRPPLALIGQCFYLLRNAPPTRLLEHWTTEPCVPVRKLSHRLLMHLRKSQTNLGVNWDDLVVTHSAAPQFVFELLEETVRLRLIAKSGRDGSTWLWSGHEWVIQEPKRRPTDKPEILDDARLEPATHWLRKLDWFTPEPGLWVADANEIFLSTLAEVWAQKPQKAEYLGNPAFQRLFLSPRQLKPRLIVKGSGIDWLSVSAEWEQEGMKLTSDDLKRLQAATGRYVKLPDAGWVELDSAAVQSAHEAMADLGIDGLAPTAQKIGMEQAAHLDEEGLKRFVDSPHAKALRERLKEFKGVPVADLPALVQAELRPYQKDGFDFLCHLTNVKLGGILADDMGLEKRCKRFPGWHGLRRAIRRIPSLAW